MTTTENTASEIIEGEIVDTNEGPQQAGEENSSGEVATRDTTDAKPVEKSDLSKREALALTKKLKSNLQSSAELLMDAYTKRIWLAFDYQSWAEYLHIEIGEYRVRLPQTERRELAARMKTEAKMSQHAIADALGWDQKTISNDLRALREEQGTGPDGAPGEGQVVGQDGKVYKETHTRARAAKPIEDRFAGVITKLDQFVGDLTAISAEEDFAEVAGSVAKTHRADIARLIDSLKGVQDRLQ